jgi:hypothetical protein
MILFDNILDYIKKYLKHFGFYPREVLAAQIHCTIVNSGALKSIGNKTPSQATWQSICNVKSCKFGRAKRNRRQDSSSQNRILSESYQNKTQGNKRKLDCHHCIVLNLVKLAEVALLCPILNFFESFSARLLKTVFQNLSIIFKQISFINQTNDSRKILNLNLV